MVTWTGRRLIQGKHHEKKVITALSDTPDQPKTTLIPNKSFLKKLEETKDSEMVAKMQHCIAKP